MTKMSLTPLYFDLQNVSDTLVIVAQTGTPGCRYDKCNMH